MAMMSSHTRGRVGLTGSPSAPHMLLLYALPGNYNGAYYAVDNQVSVRASGLASDKDILLWTMRFSVLYA